MFTLDYHHNIESEYSVLEEALDSSGYRDALNTRLRVSFKDLDNEGYALHFSTGPEFSKT